MRGDTRRWRVHNLVRRWLGVRLGILGGEDLSGIRVAAPLFVLFALLASLCASPM